MVQLTPNMPYLTLRLRFKKVGSLQYISHLDLVRTMHKIVVRAKLPLWYSEGFNPKPKMIFAAPLSIGTESICEFMDLRLVEDIPAEEVMRRLNANMTDEMQVTEAYYTTEKLTSLKWLEYEISITSPAALSVAQKASELFERDSILVEKKGKPGEVSKTVDIKPLIKRAETSVSESTLLVRILLSSSADAFLNPEYVVSALRSECGILSGDNLTGEYYSILRKRAFKEDMTPFS